MRRTRSVLVFCSIVAIVLVALVRVNAAPHSSIARAIASLTQVGERALPRSANFPESRQVTRPAATSQSPVAAAKFTATVQTDQEDYPPDTQVVVTGSGWLPREVVEMTFTEIATVPPGGYTD